VRERYAQNGWSRGAARPSRFGASSADDYDKYARLIRDLAIKLD
jgi:hypothetical protein